MSYSLSEPLGPCLETAGFLFSHSCPRSAQQRCAACAKPICQEHGHPSGDGMQCTACYQATETDEDSEDARDLEGEGDWDEDERSPLLSSSYYYKGYGHYGPGAWGHRLSEDPNDFTEADGSALDKNEAFHNLDFEEDMEGS